MRNNIQPVCLWRYKLKDRMKSACANESSMCGIGWVGATERVRAKRERRSQLEWHQEPKSSRVKRRISIPCVSQSEHDWLRSVTSRETVPPLWSIAFIFLKLTSMIITVVSAQSALIGECFLIYFSFLLFVFFKSRNYALDFCGEFIKKNNSHPQGRKKAAISSARLVFPPGTRSVLIRHLHFLCRLDGLLVFFHLLVGFPVHLSGISTIPPAIFDEEV